MNNDTYTFGRVHEADILGKTVEVQTFSKSTDKSSPSNKNGVGPVVNKLWFGTPYGSL